MGKVLARTVHVTRDDFSVVTLLPGQEVPKDLEKYFQSDFGTHRALVDADKPAQAQAAASGGSNDEYDGLDYHALKSLAKERELPQDGKVADLIARLREDDAERSATESDDDLESESGEDNSGE